jgi:hypothetical protein
LFEGAVQHQVLSFPSEQPDAPLRVIARLGNQLVEAGTHFVKAVQSRQDPNFVLKQTIPLGGTRLFSRRPFCWAR